jgi:hypothetical protein
MTENNDSDLPEGVVDLEEFRNWKTQLKRSKKTYEDLTDILQVLSLTQRVLTLYSKYSVVKELIDILHTDMLILKSHQKRHKTIIDREKKKK